MRARRLTRRAVMAGETETTDKDTHSAHSLTEDTDAGPSFRSSPRKRGSSANSHSSWPALCRPSRFGGHSASTIRDGRHIGVRKHAVLRTAMSGHDGARKVAHRHFTIALMRSADVPCFSTSQIRSPIERRSSLHQ